MKYEVIICNACNTQFAACVKEHIDTEWEEEVREYTKNGKARLDEVDKCNLDSPINPCCGDTSEPAKIMTGIELIAIERQRQIDVEGYKIDHDSETYKNGELIGAASCYAVSALNKLYYKNHPESKMDMAILKLWDGDDAWPWEAKYDKREKHDVIRSLVIAGALIAAEIDRLNTQPQS